jgi:hypothetical protein
LPYRERKEERDTFNSDDFIFAMQRGADTMVDLKHESGSYLASLVIGMKRCQRDVCEPAPLHGGCYRSPQRIAAK